MAILRQLYQAVLLCVAIHLAYQQNMAEDGYFYYQNSDYPKDCQEVLNQCTENDRNSGVYWIKPEGYEEPFEVYCDQITDGGGWTVFQRRHDGAVKFSRDWNMYKKGFGFFNQEFWLGNDKLAYLTNQKTYRLRINMTFSGQERYAEYAEFRITDEKGYYKIVQLGDFTPSGTTDLMRNQLDRPFSTSDRIPSTSNCASTQGAGGWWFGATCSLPNLNGIYTSSAHPGIHWQSGVTVTISEMKVKPAPTT
ncbi:Fibrinogen-like protein A [Holothuria leucospilota]|uniref:Fibrinogen-like protein A n=1 Tax=Holothuria leucospilota TaxID=206669 RepID=A0A9Q1H033_HOLLE|nr:Fibrinogen-like protein A [Holothuria leucospilota]